MRDWAHSRRLGTPADEAGYVVLSQPPASKLANLSRIDVRDHALGLVTQQLGGRVREQPPGGWLGPRTPSLRQGPGSASVPSGSPDPFAGTGARVLGNEPSQWSLTFAVWWVAPPWPILPVPAVLLALCRLVVKKRGPTSPGCRGANECVLSSPVVPRAGSRTRQLACPRGAMCPALERASHECHLVPSWIAWRYRIRGLHYWGGMSYWDDVADPWIDPGTYHPAKSRGGPIYNGEGS